MSLSSQNVNELVRKSYLFYKNKGFKNNDSITQAKKDVIETIEESFKKGEICALKAEELRKAVIQS